MRQELVDEFVYLNNRLPHIPSGKSIAAMLDTSRSQDAYFWGIRLKSPSMKFQPITVDLNFARLAQTRSCSNIPFESQSFKRSLDSQSNSFPVSPFWFGWTGVTCGDRFRRRSDPRRDGSWPARVRARRGKPCRHFPSRAVRLLLRYACARPSGCAD